VVEEVQEVVLLAVLMVDELVVKLEEVEMDVVDAVVESQVYHSEWSGKLPLHVRG